MDADQAQKLYDMAEEIWDSGYRRIDSDNPGWVRWHSIHGADENPPKQIPIEVWFFIRGAFFGIGDMFQKDLSQRKSI